MTEALLLRLQRFLHPHATVKILRSTDEPEVDRFLKATDAWGCALMDDQGVVWIQVNDNNGVDKLTWLEEGAHMLQYLKYGNVSLNQQEHWEREAEAMSCILARAEKLKLTPYEREDCERRRRTYGGE